MAPTMYTHPIHKQTLLEAAQQGNSDAIARLLQNTLASEGVTVKAMVNQTQLDIVLTGGGSSAHHDQAEWVISFIQQSLRQLQPQQLSTVQITWPSDARSQGDDVVSLSPSPIIPASQIPALSDNEINSIATRLVPLAPPGQASVPQIAIGGYLSQLTANGLLVTSHSQPSESPWQKRHQPDPSYTCPTITRLLNRQTELKAAIATLQAGGAINFSGESGSGKTALLRGLCHHPQLLPRFPGGLIYQRAYDRPLDDLMQNLFDALYYRRDDTHPPDSPIAQTPTQDAGSTRTVNRRKPTNLEQHQHLSQHQLCLVLDEMESSGESLQALTQWPNLALLAASRPSLDLIDSNIAPSSMGKRAASSSSVGTPAAGPPTAGSLRGQTRFSNMPNSRHLKLQGLSIKDAVVLFEEGLGRSLQPLEEKEAETLCAYVGGHPRRLIQMAALVRRRQASLTELVTQLRQGTTPEAIVLQAVSGLPESDRRLVAILAAFAGTPIHQLHLPALADLENVAEQLSALVEQGVIFTDGTFCVLANNLIAPLKKHWQLTPWIDQAIVYFKSWLGQFTGHPQGESPQGYAHNAVATIKPILSNSDILWYLIRHSIRHQNWSDVLDLGRLIEPGFWLGQQWGRWRQVLLAQLQAARSLHDPSAIALVLHQLGSRALCLDDGLTAQVCLAQAFEIRKELEDEDGAALCQHNLNILARSFFALETVVTTQPNPAPLQTQQSLSASATETTMASVGKTAALVGAGQRVGTSDAPVSTRSKNQRAKTSTAISSDGIPSPNDITSPDDIPGSETATTDTQGPSPQPPPSDPFEPEVPEAAREDEEAAVLGSSLSWLSWIWLVLGGASLALVGLVLFFLGQEPKTDISKLRPKHTFPPQRIGVISEPHKFTITNTTDSPIGIDVDFEEGDRQDFALNSNDCVSQPLPPSETCAIAATFEPQEQGPRSVAFMVQVGRNADPKRLTLQGVGANVKADLQPLDLTFESQPISERSEPQTITLKNKGTVAFMVQSSELLNNEENAFFIERDSCFGQILQPRDDCNVAVSFVPPSSKEYRSTLEIVDDRGQELWRVLITGEGGQTPIAIPTPLPSPSFGSRRFPRPNGQRRSPSGSPNETRPQNGQRDGQQDGQRNGQRNDQTGQNRPTSRNGSATPEQASSPLHQFTVRPSAIAFEQQDLNQTTSRTLRIQNTGTRSLDLETIAVGSPPFSLGEENCLEQAIKPGDDCSATINFTPTQAQPDNTSITIISTQAGSQTITVNGTGISPVAPIGADDPSPSTSPPESSPPTINRFSATPNGTLNPGDAVDLCYTLSNASSAYIVNRTTGARIDISPDSPGCISQTVATSTTYALVALQEAYEPVEQSLTLNVVAPDLEPPPRPVAIAPTGSHPIYCNSRVILEWQPVTDSGGSVSYGINLQRQDITISDEGTVEASSAWTSLSTRTTNQASLNISSTAQSPHLYRWQVQSLDAAGNASGYTGWNEFLCINP